MLRSRWINQLIPADILQKLDAVNWSDAIEKAIKMIVPGLRYYRRPGT